MTNPINQVEVIQADLIERLRKIDSDPIGCGLAQYWHRNPDGPEAAAEIERLREQVKQMREALKYAPEPYEYMTKADFKALPVTMRGFIDAHRNWLLTTRAALKETSAQPPSSSKLKEASNG